MCLHVRYGTTEGHVGYQREKDVILCFPGGTVPEISKSRLLHYVRRFLNKKAQLIRVQFHKDSDWAEWRRRSQLVYGYDEVRNVTEEDFPEPPSFFEEAVVLYPPHSAHPTAHTVIESCDSCLIDLEDKCEEFPEVFRMIRRRDLDTVEELSQLIERLTPLCNHDIEPVKWHYECTPAWPMEDDKFRVVITSRDPRVIESMNDVTAQRFISHQIRRFVTVKQCEQGRYEFNNVHWEEVDNLSDPDQTYNVDAIRFCLHVQYTGYDGIFPGGPVDTIECASIDGQFNDMVKGMQDKSITPYDRAVFRNALRMIINCKFHIVTVNNVEHIRLPRSPFKFLQETRAENRRYFLRYPTSDSFYGVASLYGLLRIRGAPPGRWNVGRGERIPVEQLVRIAYSETLGLDEEGIRVQLEHRGWTNITFPHGLQFEAKDLVYCDELPYIRHPSQIE